MKKQKAFIIVFLILVFGVFGFYFFKQFMLMTGRDTLIQTDNWTEFVPKEEKNIVDRINNKISYAKTSIENKTNNYFPFYIELNTLYEAFNFKTNQLVYDQIPLKKNYDGEYLFFDRQNQFFYLENQYSQEELEYRYRKQVDFFNALADSNIDVNIYLPTRYELTSIKQDNLSDYISRLRQDLNNNIKLCSMNIQSMEEYKIKFYKTDHHWTMFGALNGYQQIMSMLGKKPILNVNVHPVSDIKMYGSFAKTAMNKTTNDFLTDADINLEYDVTVNGQTPSEHFKPRKQEVNSNPFFDRYVEYFNGQYYNVVYDYHQPEEENLLIFCDSYAWPIDYLIAASFNKTHVFNIRFGEPLDLKQYLQDNQIEKVLFLYEGQSTLFDVYDYDFTGKVK